MIIFLKWNGSLRLSLKSDAVKLSLLQAVIQGGLNDEILTRVQPAPVTQVSDIVWHRHILLIPLMFLFLKIFRAVYQSE